MQYKVEIIPVRLTYPVEANYEGFERRGTGC